DRKCVLISASPNFLIEEIAARLKVDYCISSLHDERNGKLIGKVCRRDEKVNRFKELLPNAEVCDVYSDSVKHDKYIFSLGKKRFLAKKGTLEELPCDFD
ncbi:MAG: haloacid dehalogenase-like hydrolase, partial [Clostridia bacterium]|nr:haloacid dehalogenase-like hydrolase [Clostridia bacterium]